MPSCRQLARANCRHSEASRLHNKSCLELCWRRWPVETTVSCVLINLGVADAAVRVTILRWGSVVVVVGGRQRGRGRGVCGSEGASGEGRAAGKSERCRFIKLKKNSRRGARSHSWLPFSNKSLYSPPAPAAWHLDARPTVCTLRLATATWRQASSKATTSNSAGRLQPNNCFVLGPCAARRNPSQRSTPQQPCRPQLSPRLGGRGSVLTSHSRPQQRSRPHLACPHLPCPPSSAARSRTVPLPPKGCA
jgi:hypothetical protein